MSDSSDLRLKGWRSVRHSLPLTDCVELYLGVKPDAPAKTISVIPDLPSSWNQLSIGNLHVGSSQIAVSVKRVGVNYFTTVTAPAGWKLTIGYSLPANTQIKSVTLNGSPASVPNRPEQPRRRGSGSDKFRGTQQVRIQTK